MPDAQIVIKKVWTKTGTSDYGDYTRYDVQPQDGDQKLRYKTFKDDIGQKAQSLEGRKVLIQYTEKDNNKMIDSISDPLDDTVAPATTTGGGGGTKMAEAPETRAGITASVALQHAVAYLSDDPGNDTDPLVLADAFYAWIMSKVEAATPEKAAESVPDPSDEQRERLAGLLTKLNAEYPKNEGQKPYIDDLAVFCKQTFGKEGDLNRDEFETLIGYAEGMLKDVTVPF